MRFGFRYLFPVLVLALLAGADAGNGVAKDKSGESRGKSGESRGKSSESRGKSAESRGKSGDNPSATKSASKSSAKNNNQALRQALAESGMTMGEFSSLVKSWRSAFRNKAAFTANIDNPKSLPGRQLTYASSYVDAELALAKFESLSGVLESYSRLTEQQTKDALAILSGLDPQAVLENSSSYTEEQVGAAKALALDAAWQDYQQKEKVAQENFLNSLAGNQDGVTYDPTIHGPIRTEVDRIIVQQGFASFY